MSFSDISHNGGFRLNTLLQRDARQAQTPGLKGSADSCITWTPPEQQNVLATRSRLGQILPRSV